VFIVKLCCLTIVIFAFLPQNKKKNLLACIACSHNDRVVTYGTKAGSIDDLGSLWISLIYFFTIRFLIKLICIRVVNHG
jgi:hypothetical protein